MDRLYEIWWIVKVYDDITGITTSLSKFGYLDDIKKELESDGLWQFVSAEPENEEE